MKNSDFPIPELEKVLMIGIRQGFQSIMKSTGNFLDSVHKLPQPLPELESSVNQFLSMFEMMHVEDSIMIEMMLRGALEKNVPGYKDYRNMVVDE